MSSRRPRSAHSGWTRGPVIAQKKRKSATVARSLEIFVTFTSRDGKFLLKKVKLPLEMEHSKFRQIYLKTRSFCSIYLKTRGVQGDIRKKVGRPRKTIRITMAARKMIERESSPAGGGLQIVGTWTFIKDRGARIRNAAQCD